MKETANIYSVTLSQHLKIHAIQTGKVAVKKSFRQKKGFGLFSKLNILLDQSFTEFMPIWVYVVEHPEGTIVIDTGENAKVKEPDYFAEARPFQRYFNQTQIQFQIEKHQEIGPQLKQLGISPTDVRWVVLTHLHLDHIDGLQYFPKSQIMVHHKEIQKPYSDLPFLYPEWFQPTLFDLAEATNLPFGRIFYLTQAKDVFIIGSPGHSFGHICVILKHKGVYYLFAGDVSYDQNQLIKEELAGAHADYRRAKESIKKIKRLAKEEKVIYLPSHDAQSGYRLKNFKFVNVF